MTGEDIENYRVDFDKLSESFSYSAKSGQEWYIYPENKKFIAELKKNWFKKNGKFRKKAIRRLLKREQEWRELSFLAHTKKSLHDIFGWLWCETYKLNSRIPHRKQ